MGWQPIERPPVVPLSYCLNLAPAGTGTQTLHDVLARLQDQHNAPTRLHHNHYQAAALAEPDDAWFLVNKTRCLIMTVRDPAARLASGMRFDIETCNSHGWLTRRGFSSCMHAMNVKNASAWVPERTLRLSQPGLALYATQSILGIMPAYSSGRTVLESISSSFHRQHTCMAFRHVMSQLRFTFCALRL